MPHFYANRDCILIVPAQEDWGKLYDPPTHGEMPSEHDLACVGGLWRSLHSSCDLGPALMSFPESSCARNHGRCFSRNENKGYVTKHITSDARMSHQSKVKEKTASYRHQARKSKANTASLLYRTVFWAA